MRVQELPRHTTLFLSRLQKKPGSGWLGLFASFISSSSSAICRVVVSREGQLEMEQGEGGGSGKRPLEEVAGGTAAALEVKKQWKNPLQVQILEDAYAVTSKPSASMKEDLARRTGLDYKQVQYWFGNRRYLERHGPRKCRIRFGSDEMLCDQGYGGYGDSPLESSFSFNSTSVAYPSNGASLIPSVGGSESSISWRNSSRLLKSLEPIESQIHQSPVISQLPLSPKMLQPHPFTLSFEEMPQDIQRVVKHVEKQIGQSLRTDGPILGVEFSPLPPGAFEAPKEIVVSKKTSSEYCNGQLIQRPIDVTTKDFTFSNKSGCTLVSSSCNGKPVLDGSVHELCTDSFSSPIQKHKHSSPRSSKYENRESNNQVHFSLSSANAVEPSKPSESTCVDSNISSNGQQLNATNEQEVVHDNIHPRSQATNAQDSTHQVPGPDKNILNFQNLQVVPSGSLIVESSAQHGQIGNPESAPCGKLRNLAEPGVKTSYLADGSGENQDFTLTVSSEAKNCNQNMGNQSTSNQPFGLTSWHAHENFFVRPRKRFRSSSEGVTMNYFSDHSSVTTLIAEWKENERRAAFFVVDAEINSSDSSGTNSTHSGGYKDQTTANVVCSITGLTDYDNEGSDSGKNLLGNEDMLASYNIENNGQQMDKSYKDEGCNEDIASPTSSEKTI